MTHVDQYMHFIEKAKICALKKGLSLAKWELDIWNNEKKET